MAFKRRSKVQVEFSMSSMTDLIFLLLIFFMITSSFVAPSALNLQLPKADGKVVTDPKLQVSIDEKLNYYVNGKISAADRLQNDIEAVLTTNASDKVISLHADKSVPIDNVVTVLRIGHKLNAKVILATQPEK
ncbi:MAG: biopolymer transporter ExbD [Bacteroidota bacterium]|nr:biopolymer transporter ExbD [Bacteroidota bacterium]